MSITDTSSLLWVLLTSHTSLLLRLMNPCVRSLGISYLTFLPSIRLSLPFTIYTAIWTSRCFARLSLWLASNEIRVPRTGSLPSPSFRFHLTVDTLGVQLNLRGYNPWLKILSNLLVKQHAQHTKRFHGSCLFQKNLWLKLFYFCRSVRESFIEVSCIFHCDRRNSL